MYLEEEIKLEDRNSTSCFACLCSNRSLFPLGDYSELFSKFFDYSCMPDLRPISLCWECMAILRKVKLFKRKVDHAQSRLGYHFVDSGTPTCLSNLITTTVQVTSLGTTQVTSQLNTNTEIEENVKAEPVHDDYSDTEDYYDDQETGDIFTVGWNIGDVSNDIEENANKENVNRQVIQTRSAIRRLKDEEEKSQPNNEPERREEKKKRRVLLRSLIPYTPNKYKGNHTKRKPSYECVTDLSKEVTANIVPVAVSEVRMWMDEDRKSEMYKQFPLKCSKCVREIDCVKYHKQFHVRYADRSFVCEICEQTFETAESRQNHVLLCHTSLFQCSECGFKCHLPEVMEFHIWQHKMKVQCLSCNAVFENNEEFSKHLPQCDHCGLRFETKKDLKEHVRTHMPCICEICSKWFENDDFRKQHVSVDHPKTDTPMTVEVPIEDSFWNIEALENDLESESELAKDQEKRMDFEEGHMFTVEWDIGEASINIPENANKQNVKRKVIQKRSTKRRKVDGDKMMVAKDDDKDKPQLNIEPKKRRILSRSILPYTPNKKKIQYAKPKHTYEWVMDLSNEVTANIVPVAVSEVRMWMDEDRKSEMYKQFPLRCSKCVREIDCVRYHKQFHVRYADKFFVCEICELTFETARRRQNHVTLCHTSLFQCSKCGFKCHLPEVMEFHIWQHKRKVQCLSCKALFENNEEFSKHLPQCDHCGLKFETKKDLKEHVRTHMPCLCTICNKWFENDDVCNQHVSADHPKTDTPLTVEVPIEDSFWDMEALETDQEPESGSELENNEEVIIESGEKMKDVDKDYVPPACVEIEVDSSKVISQSKSDAELQPKNNVEQQPKKSYVKQTVLYKWVTAVTKKITANIVTVDVSEVRSYMNVDRKSEIYKQFRFRCSKCVREIDCARYHMQFHVRYSDKSFVCEICEQTFETAESRQNHVLLCHTSLFQCSECGFKCHLPEVMEFHIWQHNRKVQCLSCNAVFEDKEDYSHHLPQCDHCGVKCKTKVNLEKHILVHHLPNTCSICNKRFQSYSKCMQHHRNTHPKPKPGVSRDDSYCVTCNKQFSNAVLYLRHINTSLAHAAERGDPEPTASGLNPKERIQCSACPKTFAAKSYLNDHYHFEHLQEYRFKCEQCGKAYPRKYRLQQHILSVHEGVKPPKNKFCNFCGRGFSNNKILTHHIRTHTGERPHQCQYCQSSFAQRTALRGHVKRIHGVMLHQSLWKQN